jgi:hypothetical protein
MRAMMNSANVSISLCWGGGDFLTKNLECCNIIY